MNPIARLWNGPYTKIAYLLVVSLGAAAIAAAGVGGVGYMTYEGQANVPWATHVSETFFTGLIVTLITGIVLHRHASKRGYCLTLAHLKKCPFLGLLVLGLVLGGISTVLIYTLPHQHDAIAFHDLVRAKVIQGFGLGLFLPPLFTGLGLLRHPDIMPVTTEAPRFEAVSGEMGTVTAYVRNLILGSFVANVLLFPGLCWLFYHGKSMLEGEVVITELFFGGVVCTLISGVTGHFETAGKFGCRTCAYRGNCPFVGILVLGVVLGIVCAVAGHFYLGDAAEVSFKTVMWLKTAQAVFLAVAIPVLLINLKLLLHPQVAHRV